LRLRLLIAAVPCMLAAAASGSELAAPSVDVLHIHANTGMAAGGHAAVRVGEHVFHWEVHEDGWLRLGREPWETFWLRYGTLENRPMQALALDVAPEAREALRDTLFGLWSRQDRDLARLDARVLERRWLEQRAGGPAARLPGAGFFAPERTEHPAGRSLRSALGEAALRSELVELEARLAAGSLQGVELRDALVLRAALLALAEARGLAPGALLDPEAFLGTPGELTAGERDRLASYSSDLELALVRLLASPRPDRGRPLLLAAARHHAVRRSLESGRLLVLDALSSDELVVDAAHARKQRALLTRLAETAAADWRALRAAAFAGPLEEASYNQLEDAGTGVHEVTAALHDGRGLRVRPLGRLIPELPGAADPLPGGTAPDVAGAQAAEAAFRTTLAERYAYDIVARNCVTEIEQLLSAADPEFEMESLLAFAPFELARRVEASTLSAGATGLPSYRQERAAERRPGESRLRVALRESNTWTSTAYEGSIVDDPFFFFADGNAWLRPPQGVVNFSYAIGHAAFGLATVPFDRGRLAFRGLRGAFYSAPEIVGISIRKGRYDLLPEGVKVPGPPLRSGRFR
jgi:hypothetical protein